MELLLSRFTLLRLGSIAAHIFFWIPFQACAAAPLPALDADHAVTVSGLSSGAYMAVQFHVAHSARVKGAGAIAGGPYYCAQGSLWAAYYNCLTPGFFTPLPALARLREESERLARQGRIDPTAHLASARAWLFTGFNDHTVTRPVVDSLLAFYSSYKAAVVLVPHKLAGHTMPTEASGNADCTVSEPPFINDCDFDAAGILLQHLLGPLAPAAQAPAGRLESFDQRPFGGYATSMDDEGYVYIPRPCESERCRVHVAFHGCRQARSALKVADQFAREAGYNRWAESNRMVVLYPQAIARWFGIYNPRGCWDWWGYTGANYHTKDGAQMRAVRAMLDRLSAPRPAR